MLSALNNSLYPDQREHAASQLASVDGKSHPQAVQALVTAARKDSAPTVRANCVRALAKMQVNTPAVVDALQALRNDSDPRVRNEANIALALLAGSNGPRAAAPVSSSYSAGGR